MNEASCRICGTPCGPPVYAHDGPSISSTARIIAAPTIVYVCATCSHVQSEPVADIAGYYDTGYNVHLESDDADDLYAVEDGTPVYRAQHQARVAVRNLAPEANARVLDYGCGKGATLRALAALRPDLRLHAFDVSANYRAAWDALLPPERYACYEPPATWSGRFDAVLSFFALEHTADPCGFLRAIRALTAPGGSLHLTVPNPLANRGDLLVADHVNHFSPASLLRAFLATGWTDVRVDIFAHESAYVVDARRAETVLPLPDFDVAPAVAATRRAAAFWSDAGAAVARFAREEAGTRRAAVYGSGFYGTFIASRLPDRSHLVYFLDRNPHQQAKRVFGLPVIPPDALEDDVEVIYVGLNPDNAQRIVAGVPALARRQRAFFYL